MNEDKSVRYHRLKRRATIASAATLAIVVTTFQLSGASSALRAAAVSVTGAAAGAPVTVAVYTPICCLLLALAALPPSWYSSFVLERRYGLSRDTLRVWLRDYLKGTAVASLGVLLAAEAVYLAADLVPGIWWAAAAVVLAAGGAAVAVIAPVLLLPLFFRFRPLDRPLLQARLSELARRAGIPTVGAFEWALGERTRRPNAALVGAGATRRILVSDTLLADYSDDEIEVVLAHELAHHVHGDIGASLRLQAVLLTAGLAVAAFVLWLAAAPLGLAGPADVAGLPIVLLSVGTVAVLAAPFVNAQSRRSERRADEFALRSTGRPEAFISAMRRLGASHFADAEPSPLHVWLFHTHPSVDQRIAAARQFAASVAAPGEPAGSPEAQVSRE